MTQHIPLYLITILTAFGVSFVLTPIVRAIAIKKAVLDAPSSAIKTHKVPTPSLGGVAIAAGFFAALAAVRLFTNFPTGTLRNLRGIFIAGFIMRRLLTFECGRARTYYASALASLYGHCRRGLLPAQIMACVYAALLAKMEKDPQVVLRGRLRLGAAEKICCIFKAWRQL